MTQFFRLHTYRKIVTYFSVHLLPTSRMSWREQSVLLHLVMNVKGLLLLNRSYSVDVYKLEFVSAFYITCCSTIHQICRPMTERLMSKIVNFQYRGFKVLFLKFLYFLKYCSNEVLLYCSASILYGTWSQHWVGLQNPNFVSDTTYISLRLSYLWCWLLLTRRLY